jgi:hypothetical protein
MIPLEREDRSPPAVSFFIFERSVDITEIVLVVANFALFEFSCSSSPYRPVPVARIEDLVGDISPHIDLLKHLHTGSCILVKSEIADFNIPSSPHLCTLPRLIS